MKRPSSSAGGDVDFGVGQHRWPDQDGNRHLFIRPYGRVTVVIEDQTDNAFAIEEPAGNKPGVFQQRLNPGGSDKNS